MNLTMNTLILITLIRLFAADNLLAVMSMLSYCYVMSMNMRLNYVL